MYVTGGAGERNQLHWIEAERAKKAEEIDQLRTELNSERFITNELKKELRSYRSEREFSVERLLYKECITPGLFKYYTGVIYDRFKVLLSVVNAKGFTVAYNSHRNDVDKLQPCDCLLLTLMRLRHGYGLKDLAVRFGLKPQSVSVVFTAWVQALYLKLGQIGIWPHRDVIIKNMSKQFRKDFPTTLVIIDCTEIRTQTPSALSIQSQCYSDYKSCTTLKCLLGCDPNGSLLFVSSLYTGSISDNEICRQSGFLSLLNGLIDSGSINKGDAIMADKGFTIHKDLDNIGLLLNIPPFTSSSSQMTKNQIALTQKIAKHRIHIERLIAKIKKYKLVSHTIQTSMFGTINQIWSVCCFLTLFDNVFVREKAV